jgi:hypothetical protein
MTTDHISRRLGVHADELYTAHKVFPMLLCAARATYDESP